MRQDRSLWYRISGTLAGLGTGYFFTKNLPSPTIAQYQDHTKTHPAGQGGLSRTGFRYVTLIWDVLTVSQAQVLRAMIEAAEATGGEGNGTLYLTVPASDGQAQWIDVHGIAQMPTFTAAEQAQGLLFTEVSLKLNAVTIDNDPSGVY